MTPAVRERRRSQLAAVELAVGYWRLRRRLVSATLHEFRQRYRGAVLGLTWVGLMPLTFLGVYAFVYLAVFRMTLPEGGPADYVLYVLSGLAPYFATMEVVGQSCGALRGNLAMIKNGILPLEAVPARIALMSLVGEATAMVLLLALAAWTDRLSGNLLLLPVVLALHFTFNLGLALLMVAIGALVRDVAYVANLLLTLLLFVSPIAFTESMLPTHLRFLAEFNPVYYLAQAFRQALFHVGPPDWWALVVFMLMSIATFAFGAAVLKRFRTYVIDNV